MPQSYTGPARQSRPFICTPYVAGPDGRLGAKVPDRCPARACDDCVTTDCEVRTEYHRSRKTGPPHPLAVVRCRTHGAVFTVYPPGYAPYRRQSVLWLSHDGSPVFREKGHDPQRADFDGTLFESALDAKDGVAWARESGEATTDAPEQYWSTQGRHLRLAARITGVARELSEQVRGSSAMVLSVDGLGLLEGSRVVGYRAIGKAICSVLAKLKGGARRALDLLTCGALAGSWGEPLAWAVERRVLERAPFPITQNGSGALSRKLLQLSHKNRTSARWKSLGMLRGHERSNESLQHGAVPLRDHLPSLRPHLRR